MLGLLVHGPSRCRCTPARTTTPALWGSFVPSSPLSLPVPVGGPAHQESGTVASEIGMARVGVAPVAQSCAPGAPAALLPPDGRRETRAEPERRRYTTGAVVASGPLQAERVPPSLAPSPGHRLARVC